MLTNNVINEIKKVANITTSITLDHLTKDNVILNVKHFVEEEPLGNIEYSQYANSEEGRISLEKYFLDQCLNEDFFNAIMLIWGDHPTVEVEESLTGEYTYEEEESVIIMDNE